MPTEPANIGAYKAKFNARIASFKKAVLIKLFSSVIKDTPVLTGALRANWQFSVDIPEEGELSSTEDSTPRVTQGVLQSVQSKDEVYNLTNNLPYCNRIEYEGWSHTKAPEGMVRRNVIRIAAILQKRNTSPEDFK